MRRYVQTALIAGLMGVLANCSGATDKALPGGPDMAVILADTPAETLSAYGLFADVGVVRPADGVAAYSLINPLFSDHAVKDRLVFVPEGQAAKWHESDVFGFPVGSVLVKTFSFPETGQIETRLLIHKADGWVGLPYVWDETRTEAYYSPVGAKRDVQTTTPEGGVLRIQYAVPNQNQCKTCHQAGDAVVPIGPRARNLGAEQISAWQMAGRLGQTRSGFQSVPSIAAGEGTLATRARAYLDINCAHCHKSDGAASNSGLWLDWTIEDAVKLGIDKHPTAAGRGSGQLRRIVDAGDPDLSILAYRMASAEPGIAMPELGRSVVDEKGVELIRQWIAQLPED